MNAAHVTSAKHHVRRNRTSHVSPLHEGNAVPWHGKGLTLLDKSLSVKKALEFTGQDRKVGVRQCFMVIDDQNVEIPEARVTYWLDTKKPIKVVGTRYTATQNDEAFAWFDPFISSGRTSVESVGTLKDDNILWMLATTSIASAEIVPGDEVKAYIHLSHSHDGTLSIRAGIIPVRMANWSFLSLDPSMTSNAIIKTKHTVGIDFSTEKIASIMTTARAEFEIMVNRFRKFATKKLTKAQANAFFKDVFGGKDADKDIQKTLDTLIFLWENGDNAPLAGPTLWGAYCAVAEFNTWFRGRAADTRLQSLWFGQYGETNRKALEVATAMVES